MSKTTTARRLTAALVLSGALCGLGAGMANAATPAPAPAAAAGIQAAPAQTKGSTGITIIITNTSGSDLKLIGVTNPYGHLQDRPAQVLNAQTSTTISDESSNIEGAQLDVQYATPAGGILDFYVTVPIGSDNNAAASSSDPAFTVATVQAETGWHPTDAFTIADA